MAEDKIARERIAALDRLFSAHVERLDEVIERFEATVSDRFVAGNEFRAALNDVQQAMATRRELEAFQAEYRNAHSDLLNVVADLRTTLAVGPAELRQLVKDDSHNQGRQQGIQYVTAQLLAFIGFVAIVAGAVGHFIK
jgi:hypothetical protein